MIHGPTAPGVRFGRTCTSARSRAVRLRSPHSEGCVASNLAADSSRAHDIVPYEASSELTASWSPRHEENSAQPYHKRYKMGVPGQKTGCFEARGKGPSVAVGLGKEDESEGVARDV